jgi:hypothetical protein
VLDLGTLGYGQLYPEISRTTVPTPNDEDENGNVSAHVFDSLVKIESCLEMVGSTPYFVGSDRRIIIQKQTYIAVAAI